MKIFLEGQLDYIYFFYGFSLFLLAVICFSIDKEKKSKFPWFLLGLFALANGIAEWLNIPPIISEKSDSMPIFNLLALIISYLCLFEFARSAFYQVKKKIINKWIYLILFPFLILLVLGYKFLLKEGFIITCYFLGFPSLYFSSRIIYEFSKREKKGKCWLVALSITMSLYAVSVLIVPRASFFPANFLNLESFYNAFGVSIELIQGFLGLCAAMSIWFYSSVSADIRYKPRHKIHIFPSKWLLAFVLVVFIGAGWAFTNNLDYYAGIQIIKRSEPKANSPLHILTRELTLLGKAVFSISRNSSVRNAVSSQNAQDIEKARAILNTFKYKFGASACVLLDARGAPIVSADNSISEIKIDRSYASRPYFKDAFSGGKGYYFQLGSAYNERIYYVGYPVTDTSGKISGVAVIVKAIQTEPLFQYRLLGIVLTFLICIIAIIFFIVLMKREALIDFIEKVHAQLEEVDRMKTDFISVVSHELRTPLTSIRNAASILMKGGPAKRIIEQREEELLGIIFDNVDRQTRLVNDLLDVSKIEANVMPIFPKPIDMSNLIKDTLALMRPLAEDKNIEVALDFQSPKNMVYADPEHVRRILNNLVSNAIKFTPENGKITVRTEDAGEELKTTVLDTGIGISIFDKENLFNKFYSSSSAAAREKKGCGLGLSITKGLVEAQKGRVWVDSEPGKGSSFYFTLPALKQKRPL